ncbi:hypothetical protein ACJ41O_003096 [Fusarium nematophilum]
MTTDTVKDIAAGAMGGVAQVLIGQPFDIVKVRLQANGGNALNVASHIWHAEGPLSFYKGTLPPLLGVGACVSIQFGAFHYFRHLLEDFNKSRGRSDPSLSLSQFYMAGGSAGLTNSVISSPIEHMRIRLQTQPHGPNRLYSGTLDCVRKIWQQAGISGIYRGQAVTLLREFHGYGVWFAAYEGLVQAAMKIHEYKDRAEMPSWKFAVCGGLAGELLWLLSHPLDVIKSKMQSDGFGEGKRYATMREAFRVTWRVGGVGGLFEGIGPALLRAMPVSAGTFATVEVVRKALDGGFVRGDVEVLA